MPSKGKKQNGAQQQEKPTDAPVAVATSPVIAPAVAADSAVPAATVSSSTPVKSDSSEAANSGSKKRGKKQPSSLSADVQACQSHSNASARIHTVQRSWYGGPLSLTVSSPLLLPLSYWSALDRKLQNRPDAESLKSAGVIKDGGRLAAAQSALKRELAHDSLSRALEARSEASELVQAGVLNDPDRLAPALQGVAKSLEKNLLANALHQKLIHRTASDELAPGISKATDVAPALRSAKVALEHAITRDHVGHLLEQRPNVAELLASGISKASNVAPRLQGVQRALEHAITRDQVSHLLEQRADVHDLKKTGVLKGTGVAAALQSNQKKLERNLARSNLHHALLNRPPVEELSQRGIYLEPQEDEPEVDIQSQEQAQYNEYLAQQAQLQSQSQSVPSSAVPISRSRAFHLTRLLLKFISHLSTAGDISLHVKGALKDLVVDQDVSILDAAANFDADADAQRFKRTLVALAARR